jgi:hypothetical protein
VVAVLLLAWLLAGSGSVVGDAAVPVRFTLLPSLGVVKLMAHVTASPTAKLPTGGLGVQTAVPPAGKPATAQVTSLAAPGPALVQRKVPATGAPAAAWVGKPLNVACKSALGVAGAAFTVKGWVSVLFVLTGSAVKLLAVVVMDKGPAALGAGAVKVAVHVSAEPTSSGFGTGSGVQICAVPAGKPDKAQLAEAAALGPWFTQLPLTVTGWPAAALVGTVVLACMSA